MGKFYYLRNYSKDAKSLREKINVPCEIVVDLDDDLEVLYDLVDGLNTYDTLCLNSLDDIGYSITDALYILETLNDKDINLIVDGKPIDVRATLDRLDYEYHDALFAIINLDSFLVEER